MNSKSKLTLVGVCAAAAAMALGAVTIANADDATSPSLTTSTSQQAGHNGAGETLLTGTDAEGMSAAAMAEVPDGTVIRVETDSDGVYEAHVQKADGTEVIVQADKDFKVTGVQEENFTVTSVEEHGNMHGGRQSD